jgi:hypothetical protein
MRLAPAVVLLAATTTALADDLVYFEEDGGAAGPRGLYNFDSATGVSTLRTPVGGSQRFFGLATRPSTGVVYATDPQNTSTLWTLDIDTGAATFIGNINGDTIADISFDPLTGTLYGMGRNSERLYTIDPATGAPTLVGTSDPQVRCGMCLSPTGQMYAFSTSGVLYSVDKTTAAATLIGGGVPGVLVEDAEFTPVGNLYFTSFFGDVYRVETATGADTLVGSSGSGSGLLGIIAAPATATPCYANCDASTTVPVLNISDFACFLNRFAAGDSYANCDNSTTPPVLNVSDFACFLNRFAAGCT